MPAWRFGSVVVCAVVSQALSGCASKSSAAAPSDGGAPEASVQDSGASPDSASPFPVDVGQITKGTGPILASPKIVTVTWNADPNQAALEDFGDKLGASSYWKDGLAEYGVGPATSGAANHARIADPPGPTTDSDALSTMLATRLSDAATTWPKPDGSTIYVVYVPVGTTMTPKSVVNHSELTVGADTHVPYVIIDENANGASSVLDAATANAAHEIAETATNPHVLSDTALVGFDAPHIAWQMFVSDAEIGDICELYAGVDYKPADLPYAVQRLWSNKSAAAGRNPCVPAAAEPYYNVTPLDLETVSVFVNKDQNASTGLGYRITIGGQKKIKVGFFGELAGKSWTISAVEGNWFSPATNHRLTISVDKGTGGVGDVGEITVTANAQSLGAGNAVLMTVTSQADGLVPHTVPILIGTY